MMSTSFVGVQGENLKGLQTYTISVMNCLTISLTCNLLSWMIVSLMSTKLLLCVACLNPSDSFSTFNKEKLIRLAYFYHNEFSMVDLMVLGDQLDTYIIDLRGDDGFSCIKGIASLAEKMKKTKKNLIFSLVYMLIKLSLLLPVATAIVNRVFSAMHIVKSRLQNRM